VAWLLLLFFLTAAAFGLPLQVAVDLLPPDNDPGALVGPLVGCATALGGYVLSVRLGEGRWAGELALRPALPGLAVGAVLGLVMMTVLMGTMVVTGLYDITLVGGAPAWTGLGLALQVAVTEELWMHALLLRLLWRAFGPISASAVAALVSGALHLANPGWRHRARRGHRHRGRADVLRPLRPDRANLGADRPAPHLELRPGLPLRGGGLGQRRRRLGSRQHRPSGRAGVADRRDLRSGRLGIRPAAGRRGDGGRAVVGSGVRGNYPRDPGISIEL